MKKIKLRIISAFLLGSLILTACDKVDISKVDNKDGKIEASKVVTEVDFIEQPATDWTSYREMTDVKAIYMTGNTIGWKARFNELMDFMEKTEVNAAVIDVKDDYGELTYKSSVPMAIEIEADKTIKDKDFVATMSELEDNNIYPIARIVTFKDRTAAGQNPDLAVKSHDGSIWRDNKGDAWLNPYNRDAWEYPIQIAEEAALKGFKEIQFDYVRFPTDGKRALINYGEAVEEPMQDAIAGFLSYARERLAPLGVYVSADAFGLVTTSEDDMSLGQHLETLATSVDIICPMVYPSHYAMGTYGVAYPDSDPYTIVKTSMKIAQERIDNIDTEEPKAILRPWIQDFSAPWLKSQYGSNYVSYGPHQIREQKRATYDAGIDQWIFWNAANKYSEEGYEDI